MFFDANQVVLFITDFCYKIVLLNHYVRINFTDERGVGFSALIYASPNSLVSLSLYLHAALGTWIGNTRDARGGQVADARRRSISGRRRGIKYAFGNRGARASDLFGRIKNKGRYQRSNSADRRAANGQLILFRQLCVCGCESSFLADCLSIC